MTASSFSRSKPVRNFLHFIYKPHDICAIYLSVFSMKVVLILFSVDWLQMQQSLSHLRLHYIDSDLQHHYAFASAVLSHKIHL